MPTPAVRASTTKRARPEEVFDKMTTVRGLGSNTGEMLRRAIAATIAASDEGTGALADLRKRLMGQEKAQQPRRFRRK